MMVYKESYVPTNSSNTKFWLNLNNIIVKKLLMLSRH